MNVFTTDKIRNVVLLGHGGSGKTTLAELYRRVYDGAARALSVKYGSLYDRDHSHHAVCGDVCSICFCKTGL